MPALSKEIGDTMRDLVDHKRVCKEAKFAELPPIEQTYIASVKRKFKVLGVLSGLMGLGTMFLTYILGPLAFIGGFMLIAVGIYLFLDI